jgi:hypothetical protein
MRVAPEQINKRLANKKFLSADIDLAQFEDLRLEVLRLSEGETVPIPAPNEPEAWQRLYKIWRALKQRRETDNDPAETVKAEQSAAVEREWNAFMFQRAEFLSWLAREPISADLKEYVGLLPTDLESPVIETGDERFRGARRPDWRDIASRLSSAFWKLRQMSVLEKARVPDIMTGRRLASVVAEHEERLKAIEEKLKAQAVSRPEMAGMTLVGLRH